MKKLLFFLLLIAPHAMASDWSMELHLYSRHFADSEKIDLNEKNYGLGFSYMLSDNWKANAGLYRNSLTTYKQDCHDCPWESENIDSRYISFDRSIFKTVVYEFGLGAGVADGYKEFVDKAGVRYHKGNDYNFMGGPYLNIGGKYSVKIRYMFAVASLGAEYKF